jgi:hypothetical protein
MRKNEKSIVSRTLRDTHCTLVMMMSPFRNLHISESGSTRSFLSIDDDVCDSH